MCAKMNLFVLSAFIKWSYGYFIRQSAHSANGGMCVFAECQELDVGELFVFFKINSHIDSIKWIIDFIATSFLFAKSFMHNSKMLCEKEMENMKVRRREREREMMSTIVQMLPTIHTYHLCLKKNSQYLLCFCLSINPFVGCIDTFTQFYVTKTRTKFLSRECPFQFSSFAWHISMAHSISIENCITLYYTNKLYRLLSKWKCSSFHLISCFEALNACTKCVSAQSE